MEATRPQAPATQTPNTRETASCKVVSLPYTRLHGVGPVLTLAAAYAVTARLGLWFAIPPGYATAIYPASGLALAGVLIGGARVWVGIWLGSFVATLWTAWNT